jgi:AcrR family transcriptional regulator
VNLARDGRSTRWDAHRAARRAALVSAAVAAVRERGAAVSMEDVAARAGTSKTVVYRYFADKSALYLAVCDRVADSLVERLQTALDEAGDPSGRALLQRAVDAYLSFVEEDPDVYRFVVHPPLLDRPVDADPVADLTALIGDRVGAVLQQRLAISLVAAGTWGHALVGMVRAGGDHWVAAGAVIPRADVVRQLTDLAWGGLRATDTTDTAEDR